MLFFCACLRVLLKKYYLLNTIAFAIGLFCDTASVCSLECKTHTKRAQQEKKYVSLKPLYLLHSQKRSYTAKKLLKNAVFCDIYEIHFKNC